MKGRLFNEDNYRNVDSRINGGAGDRGRVGAGKNEHTGRDSARRGVATRSDLHEHITLCLVAALVVITMSLAASLDMEGGPRVVGTVGPIQILEASR